MCAPPSHPQSFVLLPIATWWPLQGHAYALQRNDSKKKNKQTNKQNKTKIRGCFPILTYATAWLPAKLAFIIIKFWKKNCHRSELEKKGHRRRENSSKNKMVFDSGGIPTRLVNNKPNFNSTWFTSLLWFIFMLCENTTIHLKLYCWHATHYTLYFL